MPMQASRWQRTTEKPCGVIAGCDAAQEWLLEWWWERYSAENTYPVTFIDLGMSHDARLWCEQKGEVVGVAIDMSFFKPQSEIDPHLARLWDSWVDRWSSRKAWFKKPFALLHSPYETSVWLDLDCEVLGPIDALFSQLDNSFQLAMVRGHRQAHLPRWHPDTYFSGAVIVFKHGSCIIEKWAEAAVLRNQFFFGDDFLLSALINEEKIPVLELEEIYNWRILKGVNLNALIYHWANNEKEFIRKHGGIKPYLVGFYQGLYEKDRMRME